MCCHFLHPKNEHPRRKENLPRPMEKKHQTRDKHSDFSPLRSAAVASGAGLTMLTCIGLCVYAGLRCDEYFGTSPWGLVGGSLLGGVSGIWSVIKQMLRK